MTHEQHKTVLYYDGTVEYFGRQHFPYALLAVTVFIVFNLLPIAAAFRGYLPDSTLVTKTYCMQLWTFFKEDSKMEHREV